MSNIFANSQNSRSESTMAVFPGTGQNTAGINQTVVNNNVVRSKLRILDDKVLSTILQSSNIATIPDLTLLTYNDDGFSVDENGNVIQYELGSLRGNPSLHVIQPGTLPSNSLETLVYNIFAKYNIRRENGTYTMNIVRSNGPGGDHSLSRIFLLTRAGDVRNIRNNVTITTTNSFIENNIPRSISSTQIVRNKDGAASFEILSNSLVSAIFTFPLRRRKHYYRCWINVSSGTSMNYVEGREGGFNGFDYFSNDIIIQGNAIGDQLIFQRVGATRDTDESIAPRTLYFDYSAFINGDTPSIRANYSSSSVDTALTSFVPDPYTQNWNQYVIAPGTVFNATPNSFTIFPTGQDDNDLFGFQTNIPLSTVSWDSSNLESLDYVSDRNTPHIISNRRNNCCSNSGVAVDRCLVIEYESMMM